MLELMVLVYKHEIFIKSPEKNNNFLWSLPYYKKKDKI